MLLRIPLKSSLASQTLKEIQMETLPHCNSNGDTVIRGTHCKKEKLLAKETKVHLCSNLALTYQSSNEYVLNNAVV